MTWDELKKKAEDFGYKIINDVFGEEIINENTGLEFFKDGDVCYWGEHDRQILATKKTYYEMHQIMMLLR